MPVLVSDADKEPKVSEQSEIKPDPAESLTEEPPKLEEPSQETGNSPANIPQAESLMALPKLGDMNQMLQQLREEAANEVVVSAKYELSLENVEKDWKEYADQLEQDSIRNMLINNVELELEDKKITALVSSKLVENAVRQEVRVIQQIREDFAMRDLSLNIIIDKSKMPVAPKKAKPMSNKEKLRSMYEKNPDIKTLAEKFGLRFDE